MNNNKTLEAEQHLIACALVDDAKTAELLEIPEEWFQVNAHKLVIRAIRELTSQNLSADMFAISDELNRHNQLDMVGGMGYLVELSESLPNLGYWGSYKNALFNQYKVGQLMQLNTNLAMQLNSGAKTEDIVEGLQSNLIDLLTDHHKGGIVAGFFLFTGRVVNL